MEKLMTGASSPTRFGGQRGFAPVELTIIIVVISVLGAIAFPRYAHSQLRIGAGRSWDGS
jgi:type II secretory pathway pseudopilin PulG